MLGKLKPWNRWTWSAFGKHPAARDYFQIRLQGPLARAFAQWVEEGFGQLAESSGRNGIYAWRFWSRGLKKGTLACGIGKNSGDGIGRAYPLMLLGEGHLDGWMRHWHLLPFVLAGTWDRMEYTASKRMTDIRMLEAQLLRIPAPQPHWKDMAKAVDRELHDRQTQSMAAIITAEVKQKASALTRERKLGICLDADRRAEPMLTAGAWHETLAEHLDGPPNTVFLGGNLERPMIVFFNRPLAAEDFVELWST